MNTVLQSKTPERNRLEGFVLNAVFVAMPTFASIVLMLKLFGLRQAIAEGRGAAVCFLYVVLPRADRAVALEKLPEIRQPRAAVLRRAPIVLRKVRAMALPARGVRAAREDGDRADGAGDRGGELPMISRSSFRGAAKRRARNPSGRVASPHSRLGAFILGKKRFGRCARRKSA